MVRCAIWPSWAMFASNGILFTTQFAIKNMATLDRLAPGLKMLTEQAPRGSASL